MAKPFGIRLIDIPALSCWTTLVLVVASLNLSMEKLVQVNWECSQKHFYPITSCGFNSSFIGEY